MAYNKEQILELIRRKANHPMKLKEIGKELGITAGGYASFRNVVKELVAEGRMVKLKRGRFGLASEMNVEVGIISVTRSGLGFLIREDDEDLLIPSTQMHTALDGDKVMVRQTGRSGGRDTGAVIDIVERAARNIVGIFKKGSHFCFVVPDNPRVHRDIYIRPDSVADARDGDKVVCRLLVWDDPYLNPEGEIVERLGRPGAPGVDLKTVMRMFELPETFPAEVLNEAEKAAAKSFSSEYDRRIDATNECIYTIDPADAKDHDDAVTVTKLDKGYRLGVHIADVSFYVDEGGPLDKEALLRGNSVYLPGMVVPMLPEVLSNNVCSLQVNKVRLAQSAIIDFDLRGKMIKWKVQDSVIRSKAKLSYEQVQAFFDGDSKSIRSKAVRQNLTVARELAELISNRRFAEGSLDFDLPESLLVLNDDGEVIEIGSKVRLESHRLVEEFMLAANRAIALEFFRASQPTLYRVHDKPDLEKLNEFSSLMDKLGYRFPVSKEMKPTQFARFLERIKDVPEADFINELMLRSMQKAVYQGENIGHFGLAFAHYAHFTSPIRRYPDLLVHRLLRARKNGRYPAAMARKVGSIINRVGRHCSDTERNAEAAERKAIKLKQVAYMSNRLGDEFDGIISGVTNYGFYVRLLKLGVEGMIRVSAIDDDYYHFDEKQYRLVGRRSGRAYRLGDKIVVRVAKVDKLAAEIDFEIAHPSQTKKKTRKVTKRKPIKRKR